MEVLGLAQGGDLLGGQVLGADDLAALVGGEHRVRVLDEQELDRVAAERVIVPVVLVLRVLDVLAGGPFDHLVRAVADIAGDLGGPRLAVGLDHILADGDVGREGEQLGEIAAGSGQRDGEGLVVDRLDLERVEIAGGGSVVARDDVEELTVGGGGVGGDGAFPRPLEVGRGQRLAVAPFEAVAQVEGSS